MENLEMGRRSFLRLLIGAGALCVLGGTGVPFLPSALADSGLSANQERWSRLSDQERAELRKRWAEFRAMSPEEQERLRKALGRFQSLSEEQRDRIERNFSRWKSFSPERQARIRERFSRWKGMSEERKQRLRDRNRSQAPESAPAK